MAFQAPFEYSITSYGADFTIDGLVSRLRRGDIFVPSFQRAFVWDEETQLLDVQARSPFARRRFYDVSLARDCSHRGYGAGRYCESLFGLCGWAACGMGIADKFVKKRACSRAENGAEYVSGKMGPITRDQSGAKAACWVHGGPT